METVTDLVNASMDSRHTAPPHTLKHPRAKIRQAVGVHTSREAIARLGTGRCLPGQVYLGLPRRPPREQTQMLQQIVLGIDTVFWTNDATNCILKE